MGELKELIVSIILFRKAVSDEELVRSLELHYADDQIKQAISELVQANEIRRYEYILSDEHTRRCFYMPLGSRLML